MNKKNENELIDVKEAAFHESIPDWESAGLMQTLNWAPGKKVTREAFKKALQKFRNRPQGGKGIFERSENE